MSFAKVLEIAPNLSDIARLCKVTPQAVHQWKAADTVPRKHVRVICETLGLRPYDVRPDLFEASWGYPNAKRSGKRGNAGA